MYLIFLKQISKIEVNLFAPLVEEGGNYINTSIFGKDFNGDVILYKEFFFKELDKKTKKLLKIEKSIQISSLKKEKKKLLLLETYSRLQKIYLLKLTYDIEAQKIKKALIVNDKVDYDFYNNIFFSINSSELKKKYKQNECDFNNPKFSKKQLLALMDYSHSLCPEIKFNFGNFSNFSHNKGVLNITDKNNYNLQNIISIFFHETTHFFRGFNGENNLGFRYRFESYETLEEGIAIYNEYLYGNKITEYGSFVPYYNLCYNVLIEDIDQNIKKEKIYQILKCKGYNRKKALSYYYRFYRYSRIGGNNFLLKDLIYFSGFKEVKKLLRSNPENYEKIMSGHIGVKHINNSFIKNDNNFNTKKYYKSMVKEIKKYI